MQEDCTTETQALFAGGDTDLYGYCLNDPVNFIDPRGLLNVKPGADSSTGPMTFYSVGASLVITGAEITKAGVGMIAGGGPVGWLGGGIVTVVGVATWGFGVWTIYQGTQVDSQINFEDTNSNPCK